VASCADDFCKPCRKSAALRGGCGGEDRALVVLQDLDPRRDIGGMILANLGVNSSQRKEKRNKLGDKLLHRVSFITETLATEFTVEAGRVASPMASLVTPCGVIALGVRKKSMHGMWMCQWMGRSKPAAAMNDIRTGRRGESLRHGDTLHGVRPTSGFRNNVRQSFDLLDIETV